MCKRKNDVSRHNFDFETYETEKEWITPIGEYNIVHSDCPTKDEIKKRVTDFINEIVSEEGFDDDCPACQLMKGKPYNIHYYCTKWCHECEKASHCKNFDPKSRAEEEVIEEDISSQVKELQGSSDAAGSSIIPREKNLDCFVAYS